MTKPAAFYASVHSVRTVAGRKNYQIVLEGPVEDLPKVLQAIGNINPATSTWLAIARLDPETVKEVMPADERNSIIRPDTQSREEVMPDTPVEYGPQNNTSPASGPDIPARAHKPVAAEKQLAQLAGMLSKKKLFHQYLVKIHGWKGVTNNVAADFIRDYCGVVSRSNIIAGTFAGDKFEELNYAFNRWRDADKYVEASA